ncbi:interleukin-17 receptor C isoform X2 [Megalops cyprinoides]|uniref:interleukin-17 receptor C isoform X2 n=1 Tax=Megalops cyprinoides TaxID=118141 RepID=UPI0018641174|nr:interleukin-17 receptor C isoform X2 [Megalops cyprinoides]
MLQPREAGMRRDLGLGRAAVALYVLKLVAAMEVILHHDIIVNEIVQQGSNQTGLTQLQLTLSTVQLCTAPCRSAPCQACTTCVRTRVRGRATGFLKRFTIEYLEVATNTNKRITVKTRNSIPDAVKWYGKWCNITRKYFPHQDSTQNLTTMTAWELTHDCFEARPGSAVLVTMTAYYKGSKDQKSVYSYTAEDIRTVPKFTVSVDEPSRSLTVSVAAESSVRTRLCYRQSGQCTQLPSPVDVIINTTYALSTTLSFPYLLPCLCVQVYFLYTDAERVTYCPFENKPVDGGRDVLLSSSVKLYKDLVFKPVCTDASLRPSASLCWQVQRNSSRCLPIANSTLQGKGWNYDVSNVDQHPQICVQFALYGSYTVQCPFQSVVSEWQAVVLPAVQHLRVCLSSGTPATFSAQLCVLEGESYVDRGDVYSVKMENGTTKAELSVPFTPLPAGMCVQVWRSDPHLHGRRLLCPEHSHRRLGLIVTAATIITVFMLMLAYVTYHRIKRGLSDWQLSQKPVLVVCSSEQTPQVSAVCALASVLQGELCAGVRMALWAKNTGGVAKLGPLPWIYGQCEAVRGAGGRVLIAWSPEAKEAYQSWKKEREEEEGSEGEKPPRESRGVDNKDGEDRMWWETPNLCGGKNSSQAGMLGQREPSSVTAPILRAALACLQGELQGGREGHGFALVYFDGLSHSQDIPQELRRVPQYCLPQDFGGLVQELQGGAGEAGRGRGCPCCAGLLSKILALRLAQKLRTWLPQTLPQEEGAEGIAVKPQNSKKPHSLAGLPLPLLFSKRTEQSSEWENTRLTLSVQK